MYLVPGNGEGLGLVPSILKPLRDPTMQIRRAQHYYTPSLWIAIERSECQLPRQWEGLHGVENCYQVVQARISAPACRLPEADYLPSAKPSRSCGGWGAPIATVQTSGTISPKRSFVDAAANRWLDRLDGRFSQP
jgi:hypothetical protein